MMSMYFIHADHLNTPRLITNHLGQAVWRWANDDPFGNNAPNEDPGGLGAFTCNLRLPGQYFDKETNLHYNYFRDYDPSIGRYIQSDPIGMKGGINSFAYVRSNPLSRVDPFGLFETAPYVPPRIGVGGRVICDGVLLTYELFDRALSPCIRDCARVHEERHVTDIRQRGFSCRDVRTTSDDW